MEERKCCSDFTEREKELSREYLPARVPGQAPGSKEWVLGGGSLVVFTDATGKVAQWRFAFLENATRPVAFVSAMGE